MMILVLFVIILGCSKQPVNTGEIPSESPSDSQVQTLPITPVETTRPSVNGEGDDCMILSAADVSAMCGSVKEFVKDTPQSGEICRGYFEKSDGRRLVISYLDFDIPPQRKIGGCIRGGYAGTSIPALVSSGRGCMYDHGRTVDFAGTRHVIRVSNPDQLVCVPVQMSAISDKIAAKLK
jgi:hypothetical protein